MNDNDLERQLRTQAGPREEGYVPTRLPATLDEAPARLPSPFLRAAVLVPAVAAGVLVVAVAAAVLRGPATSVGGGNSQLPSESAANAGSCTAETLHVVAEPWGGAAGSRGVVVTLSAAAGTRWTCNVALDVAARITDSSGSVLVNGASGPGAEVTALEPGRTYTVGIAWSNWCGADPTRPVTLALRLANMPSWIDVPSSSGGADPVPPCLGQNQPTNLSVTQLQPAH